MPKADIRRVRHRALDVGLGLALAGGLASCHAVESEEATLEVSALAEAVVGGETAEACEWPSTVSVNAWGSCSGTLIHPRIVTTAAHCIQDGKSTIYFGGGRSSPGAFSLEARCEVGAQGSRGANTSKDWAYCVLPEDERVKKVPVTPPLVGCEAERFLKAGEHAWVVGFGTTSSAGQGAGIKRQVDVVVNALNKAAPGTIDVGDAQQGACHGDSGGPLYVHLTDGEHDYGYRVVGSTSGAGARLCDCNCSTVYVNIANHVKAIEDNEHIDVTPCTTADGKFEASPECSALITSPQVGSGSFPSCSVARTVEPINSCGALVSVPVAGHAAPTPSAGSSSQGPESSGGSAALAAAGSGARFMSGPSSTLAAGAAAAAMQSAAAAIEVAKMPAVALVPSKLPAAGRGSVVSATFSSTAAGGGAELPPTAAADSGCSTAPALGVQRSRPGLALFALGVGLALRLPRRRRPRA